MSSCMRCSSVVMGSPSDKIDFSKRFSGRVAPVVFVWPEGWTAPVPGPEKVQRHCHASRVLRLFNSVSRTFEKEVSRLYEA
jgi:hypothetical protein